MMQCIVCSKEANYILFGNSYCFKHMKEHKKSMQEKIKEIEEKKNVGET